MSIFVITKVYDLVFKHIIYTVGPKHYLFAGKEKKVLTFL